MLYHSGSALLILLGVLCPILRVAAAGTKLIPALLGISLGSTHLTAATINGSGTFPLALVEGSHGYIDFMSNTTKQELPLEDYYDEAFDYIKESIVDIRIKASQNNGENMRIGAILAPEHFTVEMRQLVFSSWHAVNDGVWGQPPRSVSHSAVVYPENDCIDRLYNLALPDDQGEWILTFHQDFDYLSVSLSMVTTYVYETTSQKMPVPASADDIVNFLRSAADHKGHPNVASIVLSSSDKDADFKVVREALDNVDIQLWNRRKISPLELTYMTAVGAACMARQLAIFPMEDDVCEYGPVDDVETTAAFLHVEL